jgi:hypothetical protein
MLPPARFARPARLAALGALAAAALAGCPLSSDPFSPAGPAGPAGPTNPAGSPAGAGVGLEARAIAACYEIYEPDDLFDVIVYTQNQIIAHDVSRAEFEFLLVETLCQEFAERFPDADCPACIDAIMDIAYETL